MGSFSAMVNNAVSTTPLRTLALDPGTREMGYAVLESTDLLYFGVHIFPHQIRMKTREVQSSSSVIPSLKNSCATCNGLPASLCALEQGAQAFKGIGIRKKFRASLTASP
jgi:hypothetical protein